MKPEEKPPTQNPGPCCAKTAYDKRGAASAINSRLRGRHRRRHGRPEYLRSYHCPACGHWHLTHQRLR